MLNYWWVTRPKRKLNSIPEVLSTYAEISLDQEWQGQRDHHLSFEGALEHAGLKKTGERRDQTGGGGRTYQAWVAGLGLIFTQESTKRIKLTLAGEAIMNGGPPVKILTNQILKFQFPSSFSLKVKVSERFRIRPFRFILRLLSDKRIDYLTEEEIAKIIITEAERETLVCYERVVSRIIEFRDKGDKCLEKEFYEKYASSKGLVNSDKSWGHLKDIANTIVNWIEYTQLARRNEQKGLVILPERSRDVEEILSVIPPFIERPEEQERYQRKYGIDPKHQKDTRDLTRSANVTERMIAELKVKKAFLSESLRNPVTKISEKVIEKIVENTGINDSLVEEILQEIYPHGALGSFMTEYYEMAFNGPEKASQFEEATVALFRDAFGFQSRHVGPLGLTPDVLLLSDESGYQAIIDNKAYSKYSVTNDHRNRMIHNYIEKICSYSKSSYPLAFFSYIAGGFSKKISSQIQSISDQVSVPGSAISVSNMIKLVERNQISAISHANIRDIFSSNKLIEFKDI